MRYEQSGLKTRIGKIFRFRIVSYINHILCCKRASKQISKLFRFLKVVFNFKFTASHKKWQILYTTMYSLVKIRLGLFHGGKDRCFSLYQNWWIFTYATLNMIQCENPCSLSYLLIFFSWKTISRTHRVNAMHHPYKSISFIFVLVDSGQTMFSIHKNVLSPYSQKYNNNN